MSVQSDKKVLVYATKQIDLYIAAWDEKYMIFSLAPGAELPEMWNILLLKSEARYVVSTSQAATKNPNLVPCTKKHFVTAIKDYADPNYKLYYQELDQDLVGYLLDFFVYYADMPDKIITITDDNIELYEQIRNQKLK